MKTNIYPHQWELLACMLTYKVSGGACLDYERLGKKDYEKINDALPLVSPVSLQKWFGGRKPAVNALNDLCQHTSDIFPYPTWQELAQAEVHLEIISACPDWETYAKLLSAEDQSKEYKKLSSLKSWAYTRVLELTNGGIHLKSNTARQKRKAFVKEFAGTYSLFMPGQIPPEKYKAVYVNPFVIDETGDVWMQNAYNKKEFHGFATVKDTNTLQIILHDTNGDGFEYVISMRVDKYGSSAIYFPALTLGYDGQGTICSYPVLLTTDLNLNIESTFVNLYLEECYKHFLSKAKKGRMECLSPTILQSIYVKAKK
ncbi:MAG: hypothetical protein ABIQ40_01975 [Bacteroidia bacterium]